SAATCISRCACASTITTNLLLLGGLETAVRVPLERPVALSLYHETPVRPDVDGDGGYVVLADVQNPEAGLPVRYTATQIGGLLDVHQVSHLKTPAPGRLTADVLGGLPPNTQPVGMTHDHVRSRFHRVLESGGACDLGHTLDLVAVDYDRVRADLVEGLDVLNAEA